MENQPTSINQLSNKELVKLAKMRGSLTFGLMRANTIAWLVSFVLLVVLICVIAFNYFRPLPVLVVNQQGEIVAQLDYFDTANRSNASLDIAVRQFVIDKNSVNAQTVEYQRVNALNLMSPELQEINATKEAFAIREFIKNNNQGYVKINKVEQINRTGNSADYLVTGAVVLTSKSETKELPFELSIGLLVVPRTQNNLLGIIITNLN